jgi:hypothetical protein
MEKLLIGCLLLLTACQPTTTTPVALPPSTITIPVTQTPTVVPGTDTPAPTPTAELTPTPLPRHFTNEFDSPLEGWTILQTGSDTAPKIQAKNSILTLQMDSPFTWVYAVYGAQDYESVRIDAQFTNQGGTPSSIGLLCGYSESDGWLEFNVSTDGSYNVLYGQWLASGIADYLPIWSGPSGAIGASGTPQEVGMVCSGTTLSLYINLQNIRNVDVSRYELPGGKVGLTASSFENTPIIAAFDWIRVSEP